MEGLSCTTTSVSATSITCNVPAGSAGGATIVVRNSDNQTASIASGYTYQGVPVVSSINPAAGPLAGTSVTITGSNFFSGATVTIGGVLCGSPSVTSSTTINCTAGLNTAGVKNIVITNADGQSGQLENGFTYLNPPAISTVTPAAGALAGGTTITVTGADFFEGASVTVGGNPCTSVSVSSSTSLTCTTPLGSAGAADVIVRNIDNQSFTATGAYTYQPSPTVSSISPTNGVEAGNTPVTITGSDFINGATVSLGGSNCLNAIVTATTITCTTTAHAPGDVTVTVTNPDTQIGQLANGFTYDSAPVITSVAPAVGAATSATAITINGTNFLAGATVSVGGAACTGAVVNPEIITCNAQPDVAGAKNIVVTNTDGQSATRTSAFTHLDAPTITDRSPTAGPLAGSNTLTIYGTGFLASTTISVGGSACTPVTLISDTEISCPLPSGSGVAAVVVTNPDAQTASTTYTFQAAPDVTSVTPNSGIITGGASVTVNGTGFVSGATVDFGGSPCTVTGLTATTITCTTPAHAAGAINVSVTNLDGQTDSLAAGFTYDSPPTVSSISPAYGRSSGNRTVTIGGLNFVSGATVSIGGIACAVTATSATSITCTTGASATAGLSTVTVTNPDTQTGSLPSAYNYLDAPSISTFTPNGGTPDGGTTVTITGTNYAAGTSVTFNGVSCAPVTINSATSLSCPTPAGTAGAATVVVTDLDGQTATSTAYTYRFGPMISYVTPSYGRMGGGTGVTIVGTGFVTGAAVTFGGGTGSCVVASANAINCTTPVSVVSGPVAVTVTNTDSQSHTVSTGYIYLAVPTISSVTPHRGPLAGTTPITITGSGFFSGATVTVGGAACTNINIVSSSSMNCNLPSGAGASDVVVTNIDGESATLSGGYIYQAAPSISSISPANGFIGGGTSVTITGSGFVSGASVRIGSANCLSVNVVGPTSITCVTSSQSAALYDLVVTNTDGQSATSANAYTYRAAPSITTISPLIGQLSGGGTLTINGSGFFTGDIVAIGGTPCTSPVYTGSTRITCTIPSKTAGSYDVVVSSTDRQGTLFNAYTYRGAPTVTSVSPLSGVQAGNTLITITGTGFASGASVGIGSGTCTSVTVVNTTTITCRTPSTNSGGAVAVTVTNSEGQGGSLAAGYTYTSIPVLSFVVGTSSPTPPNPDSWGSTTTNVTHTFTVKNTGEGTSSAITTFISGTNSAAWMFGTDTCSGQNLAPGATCTIQVTFLGSILTTGQYSAILNATATSGGSVTNSLQGSRP